MNKDPMPKEAGFDRIAAAFKKIPQEKIPKGELWLGSKCLKRAGFEDNLSERIKFAKRFKHDMICLSLAENVYSEPSTGYRYFSVSDFDALDDVDHLFVVAVIDGPFQRLSQKMGLMQVLTGWVEDREALLTEYEQEGKSVLNSCLQNSVHVDRIEAIYHVIYT